MLYFLYCLRKGPVLTKYSFSWIVVFHFNVIPAFRELKSTPTWDQYLSLILVFVHWCCLLYQTLTFMQHLLSFEQVHVGRINRSNMLLFHIFCVLSVCPQVINLNIMYTECVCILQDWKYSCTHSYCEDYTNTSSFENPPSREGVTTTHGQSGHFGEDRNLLSLPQILHLYYSLIIVTVYVYSAVIFINTGM